MTTAETARRVAFVDLGRQHEMIAGELREAIDRVVSRGDFILGEEVELFEDEMAQYCEVSHGIGVDSGTSALELCLLALGIGPGDEVITAANTFIATALAISYTGAKPVLVDIDPVTYNLDPSLLDQAVTDRTAAIIPVHLYGLPAEMDPILEFAARHGLAVIEDASQAHGAMYRGRRTGSFSDIAAFSLYPAKNLGALGDAGVIVTNDSALAEKVRLLRNYGSTTKYHHQIKGFNRRLDTLQAAVLRVKLRHLDGWSGRRRSHAEEYGRLLGEGSAPLTVPAAPPGLEHVYHLYVIRTKERDALQAFLAHHGVSTVIHYPVPIHLQPAYEDLGHGIGAFPLTEGLADEALSLPMFAELDDREIEYVCGLVDQFFGSRGQRNGPTSAGGRGNVVADAPARPPASEL